MCTWTARWRCATTARSSGSGCAATPPTARSSPRARRTPTNKAPGGVAYRCSFRVTEAMFFQERMVQAAADDLGMDQAAFRRMNFVRDDDFPHRTPFGFLTDSGQYAK